MEKSYKLVSNGKDKQIAYPLGMSKQLIEALEAARKNKSFITITSGDMETGEAWGDLYDSKGRIGLSRGHQYLFPLLVSFKKGEYDEDLDEVHWIPPRWAIHDCFVSETSPHPHDKM